MSRLFMDLFEDSVTEDKYDADLAELSFHMAVGGDNIGVVATGFSDKLAVLLKAMLERAVAFKVDGARFADLVDRVCGTEMIKGGGDADGQYRLSLKNFKLADPYRQIGTWQSYATKPVAWTKEEKLQELECTLSRGVMRYSRKCVSDRSDHAKRHRGVRQGDL